MSRYTKRLSNGRQIAYGFDPPLNEFFLQEYKAPAELKDEDEEECIFSISNYYTMTPHPDHPQKVRYSNAEIVELMEIYGNAIPKAHRDAIGSNIPF